MSALLTASLEVAVPMWAERLRRLPWPEVEERARAASDVVASKGDHILYRSPKKGETAAAFNALAEGLAALSFAPGGVRFAGLHFNYVHPEVRPCRS